MPRFGPRAGIAVLAVTLLLTAEGCGEVDSTSHLTNQEPSPGPAQPSAPPATASVTTSTAEPTTTATSPPTSTTSAAPTTTTCPPFEPAESGPPIGLIRFGVDGIVIAPFDGDETVIPGDRYYPMVRQAAPDGTGGIVYQLLETHPSWPQGTIFRLAPGALSPEPVFVPARNTRTELYGVVYEDGGPSLLLGHQTTDLRHSTTVVVVPFYGEEPRRTLMTMPGLVGELSYGGGMFVAAVPTSSSCTALGFFDSGGDPIDPPERTGEIRGCNESYVSQPHLAADGSLLGYRSGEFIHLHSLTSGDRWAMEGYTVDYDGYSTLVSIGPEPPEAWLVKVGQDGIGASTPIEDPGWATIFHRPLEIAPDATLELAQPEVECSATGMEFAPAVADLPRAVAAKRDAIATAATSCDFIELGELAEPRDEFEFFTSCCSFRTDMEDDPVRYWLIGETADVQEMAHLVRLLQMEPGRIDGGWVWPAAVVQAESDIDWERLEELYGTGYEYLYEASRERGYYNGFVVEIMDDGRWRMFKLVIEPPIAG